MMLVHGEFRRCEVSSVGNRISVRRSISFPDFASRDHPGIDLPLFEYAASAI